MEGLSSIDYSQRRGTDRVCPSLDKVNYSETKNDIAGAQQELERANERARAAERDVREARQALRLAKQVVTEANVEKDRVQDEIENLRPKLEDVPSDSGLLEAYREAIEVHLCLNNANCKEAQEKKQKLLAQILSLRAMQEEAVQKHRQLQDTARQKKSALDAVKSQVEEANVLSAKRTFTDLID